MITILLSAALAALPTKCLVADGQSLSQGTLAAPILSTVQSGNNMRPASETYTATFEDATDPPAWPWASLNTGFNAWEHPRSGAADYLFSTTGLSFFTVHSGRGGSVFSGMAPGTTAWTYFSQQVESFGARTDGQCIAVMEDHGESDHVVGTSRSAYVAMLVARQALLQDKIRRSTKTGAQVTVPLYVSQMQSYTSTALAGHSATSPIPLAQVDACRAYPGVIACSGPKHWLDYQGGDGVHLINTSSRAMGRMHGKAIRRGQASGADLIPKSSTWQPLWIISATRSTSTIIVTYNVPCLNYATCTAPYLQWDTATVTGVSSTTRGFEYTGASITAAQICTGVNTPVTGCTNSTQVALSLSAAAAGTLRYAWTGTDGNNGGRTSGPRGPLADTDTDTAYNYALADEWVVP